MRHILSKVLVFLICTLIFSDVVHAQSNSSYNVANRLIQQQRHEEALPILKSLHQQDPQVFIYLDLLVECHIQIKEYQQAKALIENSISNGYNIGFSNVVLGELYHLEEDTTAAFEVWDRNLRLYPNQLQLYLNTANILTERKEFDRAIDVFLMGREVFNNPDLFLIDIPNVYMQAGRYQDAIAEWLSLIDKLPQQSNVFKRMLIRYNDPLLFDDSIAEIEFKLREMSMSDRNYRTFFDLQNWLLFENNLYRRAFAAAQRYESSTTDFNYTLDLVGRQLVENNEYELAIKAFDYYKENGGGEVRMMAYEKMADTYSRWAKYLEDYNLDENNQSLKLYNRSITLLDTLVSQFSFYGRIDQVYLRKAELSLDSVYNLEEAEKAIELFKRIPGKIGTTQAHYLDGRLYLAKNEYTLARIELTRSNRLAGTGELAEKSRYFLALTDFYSGDFEFAKIQLKTLGRRNTSYYANDALQLRLWLQEGTNIDTTNIEMTLFAEGIKELRTNPYDFNDNILLDYIKQFPNTLFKDDVLLALGEFTDGTNPRYVAYLNEFLNSDFPSPIKEDLLWLRALKADDYGGYPVSDESTSNIESAICFFSTTCESDVPILTPNELYEQIILEYPDGFYASYARQKLMNLPS